MRVRFSIFAAALCLFLMIGVLSIGWTQQAIRLDKDRVKEMLSDPDVTIIDVRIKSDWEASDRKIKGAIRKDAAGVKEWARMLDKEKTYVLYCA